MKYFLKSCAVADQGIMYSKAFQILFIVIWSYTFQQLEKMGNYKYIIGEWTAVCIKYNKNSAKFKKW